MADLGIISTYASGVDLVVQWKIEDFSTISERDGEEYVSPYFSFGGEEWYLDIFPNGSSDSDSSGHVDLGLGKYSSSPPIKQSFSLSLKTVKGEKYNEEHGTMAFDRRNCFYECNRFIPRSELTMRRSELVPDGTLTVICTMKKNSTSAGSDTRKYPQPLCVEVSTQTVEASIQTVETSTQTVEASTQNVEATIQSVDTSTQTVGKKSSTQHVGASTRRLRASTRRLTASTQRVRTSTQTVEASTQTVEEKYEATASGSSINSQEKKVLHDLKELFLNKEDCDVTIRVEGSEFPAHRAILKARSPVFASTFRHDMKENATGILEIKDCRPSTFSDFLCFLYCGDVGIISQENVFGLFTAADKYQILDLRVKCLEFMKKNITVDTFCETLTLALRHSETELIKLCTDYFKENIPKIIVTVKWQTFLAENPTQSNELLVKCFVPNSS